MCRVNKPYKIHCVSTDLIDFNINISEKAKKEAEEYAKKAESEKNKAEQEILEASKFFLKFKCQTFYVIFRYYDGNASCLGVHGKDFFPKSYA